MTDSIPDISEKENIDADLADRSADDDDIDLVLEAQSGNADAFGSLIERHQRTVYGIVSRMVNQQDEVDDIVQDVFITAWKSICGFKRKAKFSTWLHTIAVNTAIRRAKAMKKRSGPSFDDPDTGLAETMPDDSERQSPYAVVEKSERDSAIRRAIESLPEKHRIVIVLHYYEHYSCDEIASVLGCSTGTVWSRLHYSCKRLKNELKWLVQDN